MTSSTIADEWFADFIARCQTRNGIRRVLNERPRDWERRAVWHRGDKFERDTERLRKLLAKTRAERPSYPFEYGAVTTEAVAYWVARHAAGRSLHDLAFESGVPWPDICWHITNHINQEKETRR